MASTSSFLHRLTLSNDAQPLLPFHSSSSNRHTLRQKHSEYDLADLSPRAESNHSSLQQDYQEGDAATGPSTTPMNNEMPSLSEFALPRSKNRVLFAGPPAPIATSVLLRKDEEEGSSSRTHITSPTRPREERFSAPNAVGSVIFHRVGASSAKRSPREANPQYEPDSVWHSLQRREKALQKDAQHYLDVQAVGLSAGLGRPMSSTPSPIPDSSASDSAGSVSTATYGGRLSSGGRHTSQSRLTIDLPIRATAKGEVIPVRQPRAKPMGLRAARAGLGRTMALLADLKAEEDASLAAALSARKGALEQLRRMTVRREGLAEDLHTLESDEDEPLGRQLRELSDDHRVVCSQILELEERLAVLRNKRRRMEFDMETLRNKREAGLSGYRGALKEIEGQISAVLRRPPVKPLDVSAFSVPSGSPSEESEGPRFAEADSSPGGLEFLRLLPERRTASMAKDWWQNEVDVLEKRKVEVDKERSALEEGAEVWGACSKLVTNFEADLRSQMRSESDTDGSDQKSPEEKLRTQLTRMHTVIADLEEHLQIVERKGWNLLICAIGAEIEAFKEAEMMLRGAMRNSGMDVEEDTQDTPRLSRSNADTRSSMDQQQQQSVKDRDDEPLVDIQNDKAAESDDEVPGDLLVGDDNSTTGQQPQPRDHQTQDETSSPNANLEREDSENEIPPEFLREHHADDDVE